MENLTEEDFAYTIAEQEKINILREKRKIELKNTHVYRINNKNKLKNGDYVFVTLLGVTIAGYIINSYENYDVSTPNGILYNLPNINLKLRHVQDLSHIVIPDEIKQMTTINLLKALSANRSMGYPGARDKVSVVYYGYTYYNPDFLKAELKNRSHISNKRERKLFKK